MTQHIGVVNPDDLEVSVLVNSIGRETPDFPYKSEILKKLKRDVVQMSLTPEEVYARQDATRFFLENPEARNLVLGLDELPSSNGVLTEVPETVTEESYGEIKTQLERAFNRMRVYQENATQIGSIHSRHNPELIHEITVIAKGESQSPPLEELLMTETIPLEIWAEGSVSMYKSKFGMSASAALGTLPWLSTIPLDGGTGIAVGLFGSLMGFLGGMTALTNYEESVASVEEASQFFLHVRNEETDEYSVLPMNVSEAGRTEFFNRIQRKSNSSHNPGDEIIFSNGKFDLEFKYDIEKDRVSVEHRREGKEKSGASIGSTEMRWPNTSQEGVYRENDYLVRDTGLLYARELATIDMKGEDLELILNLTYPFEERMKQIVSYAAIAEWASKVQDQKRHIYFPRVDEDSIKLEEMIHPVLATKNRWVMPNDFDESEGRLRSYTGPLGNGKSTHLLSVGLQAAMAHTGLPSTAKFAQYRSLSGVLVQTTRSGSIDEELSRMMNDARGMRNAVELVSPDTIVILDDTYIGAPPQDSTCGLIEGIRALDSTGALVMVATHLHDVARWVGGNGGVNYHVKAEEDGEKLYAIRPGMSTKSHMDRVLREQGADYESISSLFRQRIADGNLLTTPKMTAYLKNGTEETV